MGKKYYLCVEMAGKGLISRMSDECLMKGKSWLPYFDEYQAGMRKFTLAGKARLLQQIVIEFNYSIAKCEAFCLDSITYLRHCLIRK